MPREPYAAWQTCSSGTRPPRNVAKYYINLCFSLFFIEVTWRMEHAWLNEQRFQ